MFDVNTSLIRFWETEFKAIKPKKNKKGNRLFTQKDIDSIKKIYHLVKEKGYTLEGAKTALKEGESDSGANKDVIDNLEAIKKQLGVRAGKNKSNLKIPPGRVVPFMIVFSDLPDNLDEYTIEVVESFPAL